MTRPRSFLGQGLPLSGGAAADVVPSASAPEVVVDPADAPPTGRPSRGRPPGVDADGDASGPSVATGETESVRLTRSQRRKQWRDEDRARRFAARRSVRFPIFTRAVLLWMLLFGLFGLAFGASGAFWWTNFNTQVAEIREETRDIEARSTEALAQIEAERNAAVTQIEQALVPLQGFLSEARTVQLAELFAPSVWFVATLDEEGRPSVGSAFSVATNPGETLLVTSFATVRASSVNPGPEITLRQGTEEVRATLVNFDPNLDLALLQTSRGDIPVLDWATDDQQSKALGSRVFPVSGFGGAGASLTSGLVMDQNAAGFLHTAPVGLFMQGGPVVTADGKVIGVASVDYKPFGFDPGEVHASVPINIVCVSLLDCGGGVRRRAEPAG